jgi:hypothetical protein
MHLFEEIPGHYYKFLNNSLQILLSDRALNFQKSKTLNFYMGLSYKKI